MPKKKDLTLEEIIAVAKEAHRFSKAEHDLLSSVVFTPPPRTSSRPASALHGKSDGATFQEKLQYTYGL